MRRALFQLHFAVFLFGFTGILGKLITLNEGLLVWYRMAITVTTLFFLLKWKKELKLVSKPLFLKLFFIGFFISIHWVCFFGSIKYSNVSIALTCFSSTGLFTSFIEPFFCKKKIAFSEVLLGLIGILGIYIIFHFDPQYKIGIILGILAAVLSALFSVMNKKIVDTNSLSSHTIVFYEMVGGVLFLTLLMPFYFHQFPPSHTLPTISDTLWLLILSWLCTILAMNLMLKSLKKMSAFTQNLSLNLEPVYGIIMAFIFFKENELLSLQFYYGFGLILLAVILQMFRVIKSPFKTFIKN